MASDKLKRLAGAISSREAGDPLYVAGVNEGRARMKKAVLSHLEQQYMSRDLDRTSPKAKALLELAADLSKNMQQDDFGA